MLVAVYGSLRRGGGNNDFLSGADFIREDRLEGYSIFQAFGSIPGIKPDINGSVVVELYDNYNLEALDGLEGEGILYLREVVDVSGDPCYVYVYPHKVDLTTKIYSGDYNERDW